MENDNKFLTLLFILLVISLTNTMILGVMNGRINKIDTTILVKDTADKIAYYNFPSEAQINSFCLRNGYSFGYVSSNVCEKGIYCYNEIKSNDGETGYLSKCFQGDKLR